MCTWPNRPVGAKILSGFQFEGKTDVWISQVRRVKVDLESSMHVFLQRRFMKLGWFCLEVTQSVLEYLLTRMIIWKVRWISKKYNVVSENKDDLACMPA